MESKNILPLASCVESESLTVISMQGCEGIEGKLNAMGIYNGCVLQIMQKQKNAPFVISRNNSRIAIGRVVAEKIMVSRLTCVK